MDTGVITDNPLTSGPTGGGGTTYSAGPGLNLTGTTFSIFTGGVTNAMLAGGIDLTSKVSGLLPDGNIASASTWNAKQSALVSGTNIKTVNGTSLLGSGDLGIIT